MYRTSLAGYVIGMVDTYLEHERKFDVPGDFAFPELPGARCRTHHLRATYYDTDDALLQTQGVVLRRRVGGADDGWHVKAPHPDGKVELQSDVRPTRPPREMTTLTRGLRFDRGLQRRALLVTERDAYRLHASNGELIAEVADDRVEATLTATGESLSWREVEVELGPAGRTKEGTQLADLLTAAGATPAQHASKYARAVGDGLDRPSLSGLAGLVDDYLQTQYDRLVWGDLRMRRGENVVHKTRVAVRRTRSTLRIFAPLLDPRRATDIDRELSWYADALGRVRDLDVARRRVENDLRGDAGRCLSEQTGASLLRILDHEREQARQQLMTLLDGRRYGALLRELHAWRREPPMTTAAGAEAEAVEEYVRGAREKSDNRRQRAGAADDESAGAAFHRARKAVKRTRYAAELARPALGKPAKKLARSYEKQQDALGELQDHVLVISLLRTVTGSRGTSAEVGFACGLLVDRHHRAQARACRALR
jgi:CHAD domain-containing protein